MVSGGYDWDIVCGDVVLLVPICWFIWHQSSISIKVSQAAYLVYTTHEDYLRARGDDFLEDDIYDGGSANLTEVTKKARCTTLVCTCKHGSTCILWMYLQYLQILFIVPNPIQFIRGT